MGFDQDWDSVDVSSSPGNSFDAMWDNVPEPSFLESAWEDIKGTPRAAYETVAAIPSGISNVFNSVFHPVESYNTGVTEKTVRGVGTLGSAALGGMTGAEIGAFGGPIGALLGGAVGAAGGALGFNKANQLTGVDEPTTLAEDLADLRRNTIQNTLLAGAAKAGASAIGRTIGPQTTRGAEIVAGDTLGKFITPQELEAGIVDARVNPLGAMRTTAEVTGSPEVAMIEQQFGTSADKALDYAKFQNETRRLAQEDLSKSLSEATDLPTEVSGEAAQKAIAVEKEASRVRRNELYDQIPLGTVPPPESLAEMRTGIESLKEKYFGLGAGDVPAELRDRLDFLSDPKNEGLLTLPVLQKAKSALGSFAKKNLAKDFSHTTESALAAEAADQIRSVILNAPEGAQEWRAANAAAAEHARKYKEGPLEKIINPSTLPSKAIDKILSSPEAAKQFRTMVNDSPEAISPVKDQIASNLAEMSDAKKVAFINKHESQLKTLLKDDFYVLDSLRTDIQSRTKAQASANATRGSNTALKLSPIVQKAITGKSPQVEPGMWDKLFKGMVQGLGVGAAYAKPAIAIPVIAANAGIKALRNRSTGLVQDALFKAVMSPESAKAALDTALEGSTAGAKTAKGLARAVPLAATNQAIGKVFSKKDKMDDKAVEAQIKSDPFAAAVYETESSSGKRLTNDQSSAKGGFQLIDETAKKLGVSNAMDLTQNYEGFKKLTDENKKMFQTEDPDLLYAAHFLGATVLRKVLKGESLTDNQLKHVKEFKEVALPRFLRIYDKIISEGNVA